MSLWACVCVFVCVGAIDTGFWYVSQGTFYDFISLKTQRRKIVNKILHALSELKEGVQSHSDIAGER